MKKNNPKNTPSAQWEPNWYFFLAGALILYFTVLGWIQRSEPTGPLTNIRITLYRDVESVKGRKSIIDYKFWSNEYKVQFNILDGSLSSGRYKEILQLKAGDSLDLVIKESALTALYDKSDEVTVRGLTYQGRELLSSKEFKANRSQYTLRTLIFSGFIAFMLLLNGLVWVPSKINYIIIGIFVGTLIILNVFDLWIYS